MSRRQLTEIERKIVERDLEHLRYLKDSETERYITEIHYLTDAIKNHEKMLDYGVEEGVNE